MLVKKTRRGSPVDRRPSPAEVSPIGQIFPFSKMAITFEPLMGFRCPGIPKALDHYDIVYFIAGSSILNRLGVAAP